MPLNDEDMARFHDAIRQGERKAAVEIFNDHRQDIFALDAADKNAGLIVECAARLLDRDTSHIEDLESLLNRLNDNPDPSLSTVTRRVLAQGIVYFHREQFVPAVNELTLAVLNADLLPAELDLKAITRFYLIRAHHRRGDLTLGTAVAERAIQLDPQIRSVALCQLALAWIEFEQGNVGRAKALAEAAESIIDKHNEYTDKCNVLALRARILRQQGPKFYADAEAILRDALKRYGPDSTYIGHARCHVDLALLLFLRAKTTAHDESARLMVQANEALNTAERLCRDQGRRRDRVLDRVHYFRARFISELGTGDFDQAQKEAKQAFEIAERIHDKVIAAHALITLSNIERDRDHHLECKELAEAAVAVGTDNRRVKARARICLALACLQPGIGDRTRAQDLCKEAQKLLLTSDNDYLREDFNELDKLLRDPRTAQLTLVVPLSAFSNTSGKVGRRPGLRVTLREIQKVVVSHFVEAENGNKNRAAKLLKTTSQRLTDVLRDNKVELHKDWLRPE